MKMSRQGKYFYHQARRRTPLPKSNQHLCPCNGLNAVWCLNRRTGLIAATFAAAFDDCRRHIASIKSHRQVACSTWFGLLLIFCINPGGYNGTANFPLPIKQGDGIARCRRVNGTTKRIGGFVIRFLTHSQT